MTTVAQPPKKDRISRSCYATSQYSTSKLPHLIWDNSVYLCLILETLQQSGSAVLSPLFYPRGIKGEKQLERKFFRSGGLPVYSPVEFFTL
jgi:hypothetical protein